MIHTWDRLYFGSFCVPSRYKKNKTNQTCEVDRCVARVHMETGSRFAWRTTTVVRLPAPRPTPPSYAVDTCVPVPAPIRCSEQMCGMCTNGHTLKQSVDWTVYGHNLALAQGTHGTQQHSRPPHGHGFKVCMAHNNIRVTIRPRPHPMCSGQVCGTCRHGHTL